MQGRWSGYGFYIWHEQWPFPTPNKWVAFYCITRPIKRQIPNQEQGRSLKVRTVQMSFTWPNVPSKINQVLSVLLAFQFDYRSRAVAMLKTDKTLGKKLVSHTFIKSSSELYNIIQNLQLRSDRKTRNQIQGYLVFLDIIHNFGKLKRQELTTQNVGEFAFRFRGCLVRAS